MLRQTRCRVLTLAVLLLTLDNVPLATGVESKHVSDSKVRQVVSVLQGISQKLASEREKESVVYDEIKRYCGADGASENENAKPGIGTQSENEQTPQDAASTVPVPKQTEKEAEPSASAHKAAMVIWGSGREDESEEVDPDDQQSRDLATAAASDESDVASPTDDSDGSNEATPAADTKVTSQPKPAAPVQKSASAKLDVADPSVDIEQMDAHIAQMDALLGDEGSAQDAKATKAAKATIETVKVAPKQLQRSKPAPKRQLKIAKPAPKRHVTVAIAKAKAKVASKPKPLEVDDSSGMDSLANIVKAAIDPGEDSLANIVKAQPVVAAVAQPDGDYEPLASDVLAIDDAADSSPRPEEKPQKHAQMVMQRVPDRPRTSSGLDAYIKVSEIIPVYVDPKTVKAMKSEFDETANEVASLERDLPTHEQPVSKEALAAKALAKADAALVAKAVSKAEQQANGDTNVVDMSAAFSDLGGAIPSIDQQAMQLYSSFGAEPAATDTLGGDSTGPASFLQVTKHHLAPAMRADLDAAYDALKEVAEDSKSALSMMDQVRQADEADEDASKPSGSWDALSKNAQCTMLMQKFEHRQAARSKHQADLEKRSQRLLEELQVRPDRKAKHLRSPHSS